MAKKHLITVTRTQGNNRALKDATVVPENYRFDFEEVPVLVQAFRRMVRSLEFDVCEMAITTYICAKEHKKPFTALPIFLVRGFHHGAILYNTNSGIQGPKDIEGRKVGVNRGYTVTTGVWARGILEEHYGVDLNKVTWLLSGDEHVAEYQAPPNVTSMPEGATLEDLLISGEIDAAIGIETVQPDIAPLIPDPDETAYQALKTRGLYPINHLIVVRDDLLDRYPDLAEDVFGAFLKAKELYVETLRAGAAAESNATDRMYRRVMEITGKDPLPYGIEKNRATIEKLIDHALSQSIITSRPTIEDLFATSTLNLEA